MCPLGAGHRASAQPCSSPIPRDALLGMPCAQRGLLPSCHRGDPLLPVPRTSLELSETPNLVTAVRVSEDRGASSPPAVSKERLR